MENSGTENVDTFKSGWNVRKQIFAAWGGWLLDGYSTIAYLVVIYTLANIIFPSYLATWALVLTAGGVAFGATARVAGSTILGNYIGDKIGRKSLLTWSIVGFTLFTALIGLVPSYATAGILAPILVFVLVSLAGLFAGAEYGGGASLAMESVGREKRNIVGAFVQSGFGTGYFIVILVDLALTNVLGAGNFVAYGWRYLFIFALIPGIFTLVIRRISHESPVFEEMLEKKETVKSPALEMVTKSYSSMLPMIMVMSGLLFINTATFSFYPVLVSNGGSLSMPGNNSLYALLIINFVSLLGVWTGGILFSNYPSRRNLMLMFAIIFVVPSAIYIYSGFSANFIDFTAVFSIQAFFEAMIFSLLPAFLSENFSKKYRTTAVGVSYNSGAVIGGLAIVILLFEAKFMDLKLAWTIDLYVAGLVMIFGLILIKDIGKEQRDAINQ